MILSMDSETYLYETDERYRGHSWEAADWVRWRQTCAGDKICTFILTLTRGSLGNYRSFKEHIEFGFPE